MKQNGKVPPRELQLCDGKRVLIREAVEEDASSILDYLRRNSDRFPYMITTLEEVESNPKTQMQIIQAHHRLSNCLMIVAVSDFQVVGLLNCLGGQKKRVRHDGEFGVSVDMSLLRQGIGSAMIDILLQWAEQKSSLERLTLMVMHDNTHAINLYRRYGFAQEGIKRCAVKFGPSQYQDLIMMARWLSSREG